MAIETKTSGEQPQRTSSPIRIKARKLQRLLGMLTLIAVPAFAGGPRWVAGSSYFDPAVEGRPITWRGGVVNYYTDQGDLSSTVNQAQANALVATAAAMWSGVRTAGLAITAAGSLGEDVNGSNIAGSKMAGLDIADATAGAVAPADINRLATQKPLAIVYDFDGAVTDTLLGSDASDPASCLSSGVSLFVDGMSTDGTVNHALMVLNGRCAGPDKPGLMQYLVTRAFGSLLGLGWSQTNDDIFNNSEPSGSDARSSWPLMHPIERLCNGSGGGNCMPGALGLRPDDIAELNRLYPVTAGNIGNFTGKTLTAASTVSIQGVIHFRNGQGMQGVNVIAQPLLPGSAQPDPRYTVTAVSGALFRGNAGNPLGGVLDPQGNPLSNRGGTDPSLEGAFDLSGMVMPDGATQADYQLTFEAINPMNRGAQVVGPYTLGQVLPSGTMPVILLRGVQAGQAKIEDLTIEDSNQDLGLGADGTENQPADLPGNGEWLAKLDGYGHSNWFRWHILAGRQFSIETQALDEQGRATSDKAQPVLGIWDAVNPPGADPANPIIETLQPFNGGQVGLTLMRVEAVADGNVRLGVADQRGDGRPDFLYRGRVLYAESVAPQRIAATGAPITIRGVGFRPRNVVTIDGVVAAITSLISTEISAVAPAAGAGVSGDVDLTVYDPVTQGSTTIHAGHAGLSYDAGKTDSLGIVTAPSGTVPLDVPVAFTVRTLASDGATPAGGLMVTYAVTSGTAILGCGQLSCTVVSSGDGVSTLEITPTSLLTAIVTVSLGNGARVEAHFIGGPAPQIAALTSMLYLAQGASFAWAPTALVLSAGTPSSGQTVQWSSDAIGVTFSASSTTSDSQGHATAQVLLGPLPSAATVQVNACLPSGGTNCAAFFVASVNPSIAGLVPVSGTAQTLSATDQPATVWLRVEDAAGHSMAGGIVNFYETLTEWHAPCSMHGRCPAAQVLGQQTVQAVSGPDGLVSLTPLTGQGTATLLQVVAVTGGDTTLSFQVEQHP